MRGFVARRCLAASHLGTPPHLAATLLARRCFSMPDPSSLFTSPAGLMALLYGRTGGDGSDTSNSLTRGDSEGPHREGRGRRRARQQQRHSAGATGSSDEGGAGGGAAAGHSGFFSPSSMQAVVLAGAIFLLSALWDVFVSQKSTLWAAIRNSAATTLEVRSSAPEFAMIVDWMGRQPHGQRIRNLSLRPVTVQDEQKTIWGSESSLPTDDASVAAEEPRVKLVPGYGSYLFRFGSTWVYITRSEDPSKQKSAAANRVDRENDKLTLTFLTRRRAVVQSFMTHVQDSWRDHVHNTVRIYLSEGFSQRWRLLSERIRRPLATLYLPPETKAVVEEARLFLTLRDTYAALGIPWRRGYLLEGPPGTGKSSFVMALAGELGLPVHVLSLRSDNMDDDALLSLTSSLPRRSILLIEDLENVLKNPPGPASGSATTAAAAAPEKTAAYSTDVGGGPRSSMSLSALLNALDGVAGSEGRLLLITTNDTSRIPFADVLLRPGRIDRRVAFQPLRPEQVLEMQLAFQQALVSSPSAPLRGEQLTATAAAFTPLDSDPSVTRTPAEYQQKLLGAVYASLSSAAAQASAVPADAP